MKTALLTITLLFACTLSFGQTKTYAFFMIGNYNYPEWEKLEFTLNNKEKEIRYSYRKNEAGYKLSQMGTKYVNNQKALIIKIPKFNKIYLITIDKKNNRIQMVSEDGTYNKYFPLGYEGPVDGKGTYCDTCANEPQEAFGIVNSFF
jgi:hypothetical protein